MSLGEPEFSPYTKWDLFKDWWSHNTPIISDEALFAVRVVSGTVLAIALPILGYLIFK